MPTLRTPDSELGPFRERDTQTLVATVADESGAGIPGADLATLTWTLYLEKSPYAIINSRDHVNAKADVDVNGLLTIELTQDDMQMILSKVAENHRMLIEWTWVDGIAKRGSWEIRIMMENVEKVPT